MTVSFAWRGAFTNTEVNVLHAEAFETRVFSSEEWDWSALTERFSLGWVTARLGRDLVGFVNVLADGLVHAWLQDVMVAASARGDDEEGHEEQGHERPTHPMFPSIADTGRRGLCSLALRWDWSDWDCSWGPQRYRALTRSIRSARRC